jgi:hypothetical protein
MYYDKLQSKLDSYIAEHISGKSDLILYRGSVSKCSPIIRCRCGLLLLLLLILLRILSLLPLASPPITPGWRIRSDRSRTGWMSWPLLVQRIHAILGRRRGTITPPPVS